ncbi:sugar-binding domain-containing protein [Pseudactinotalea sp. HY160]|uniref:sugar-binding transcriptional regulator n=1 Tax=Pseudactinotalea sp. HY160 TaxID=2654490 RepID=UPI001883E6F2
MGAHLSSRLRGAETDRALLAKVARSYYLDAGSKVEIADSLGISRFRVARLLERALAEGVVQITINDDGLDDPVLSAELGEYLGLDECLVVRCYGDPDQVRAQVGGAAASLLSATLGEDEVLGLTWGRTLTATTSQLTSLPRCTVVQLTGSVSGELGSSPIEIVRQASQRAGGAVYPIFSPLFVDDALTAESLRQHPGIKLALDFFDEVTTAVMSVGSWDPQISQVPEVIPEADVRRARERGCVADIAGILIGADGKLVDPAFQERCVSISYAQLDAIPRVIAVASDAGKADAIRAVTCAGLVSSLVVDHGLAEALLAGERA